MTDTLREQLQATFGTAYALERELGGGGMSRVFVARDVALDREVVIKVIKGDLAEGLSAERFTREVKLAARLQQANIVPVLTAGTANGVPYYTMPFVKGESLRARIVNGVPMTLTESTSILRDVARALAYAHAEGVVHRDIKPENILLSGGAAVVTDFGIAKAMSVSRTDDGSASGALTQAGMSLGTPAYMAPEQALGDPDTDHRADLYAWGVIAYELLAGAHPFAGRSTTHALIAAHVSDAPNVLHVVNAQVPPALSALVMRALEKDPARRPQSASEVLTALESLGHQPLAAHASANATASTSRRKTVARTSLAAIAVLAVVALAWSTRRGAPSAAALERSVIVLPFENSSRDTTQEYFADGLTDELMGRLAAAGLRVTGRNTAFAYKGKHPTAREAGRVAGVATVLSGQVRRLGEQFRVTAELASAANDSVMWSYTKDSRTAEIFATQRELVDSIIARFQIAPRPVAAGQATDASVPPLAHDYVLRGRFATYQNSLDGFKAALVLYDSALALAPRYVDALLGKATVVMLLGDGYESPRTVLPRVQAILDVVAGIDTSRADYWGTRALLGASWIMDWPTVLYDAARARAIDPLNTNALQAEALAHVTSPGSLTAFSAALDTLQRSDPLSPSAPILRLIAYSFSGVRDSAQAAWQRFPDYLRKGSYGDGWEGIAMLALGRDADAERAFRECERTLGHPSPLRVVALARLGRTIEARAQFTRAEQAFGNTYFPPELIAAGAAELGDTTAMYRWLEIGRRERSSWGAGLGAWDRPFVAHREEPHFQRILKQMGVKAATLGARPGS